MSNQTMQAANAPEQPLSAQDVNNKIFGTNVEGKPIVEAQPEPAAPTVVDKTKKAVDVIANDFLENEQAHPEETRTAFQNNPLPHEDNPLNQITKPDGDPVRTAQYFKGRKVQLENDLRNELASIPNNPQAPQLRQQAVIDITNKYNQKISDLQDASKHLTSMQLFQKEYADKPLTPAETDTKLDALAKQRESDIRNANKQMQETSGYFDLDKADNIRREKIAVINKQYQANANKIRSQSKWDSVRLGIEQKRLLGDKQAEQDAVNYDNGKPIPDARKYQYQVDGNEVKKTGMEMAEHRGQTPITEEAAPHIESPQKIEQDNIDYLKSEWANKVANEKYKDENPLFGSIIPHIGNVSKSDIKEYGERAGLTPDQIKQVDPEDVGTSATWWQKFGKGALNTAAPLYEQGIRAAVALTGGDQEAVDEHFKPGWEEQKGLGAAIVGNMPSEQNATSLHNIRGVIGQAFEGAGGLSTFAGEIGGVAKGLEAAGLASNALAAEKAANFGVMAFNGYNNAYHDATEIVGDKPQDEWKRQGYALLNGIIEGKIFSISPKSQLVKNALGVEEKTGEQLLTEIKKAKSAEVFATPEFKDKMTQYITEIAKENGTQVSLAVANELSKNAINTLINPKSSKNIPDEIKNTAVSTAIAMSIPSIISGIRHVNAQTPLNKAAMFEVGSNPNRYTKFISDQLAEGKISPEDAQVMHEGVLTMKNIIKHTPTTNIEGQPMTPDQVKDYSFNLFQEQIMQQKADALTEGAKLAQMPVDKAQMAPINKRIGELQNERADILKKAGETKPPLPLPEVKEEKISEPEVERSVATEAKSEEETPAAKKSEENVVNSEKEDISLSPLSESDNNVNEKINDHGKSNEGRDGRSRKSESNEGRQSSSEISEATGRGQDSEVRSAASGELPRIEEDRQLKEVNTKETEAKAAPETEQPLVVAEKRKRKKLIAEEEEPISKAEEKPVENASIQSEKQQQESAQSGGGQEHARTEQAGSETAPIEAASGDSNIGSEAEEKIASPLQKAIEHTKAGGISDSDLNEAIRKANDLRDKAKALENKSDLESQSKQYELKDQADKIQESAVSKIAPFEKVADTEDEVLNLKSKKFNETKCRELSKKHQKEYGGKYEEVEVTNQDGSKVTHAVVVHDGYVYEPQSDALIKKGVFDDFFNTNTADKKNSEPAPERSVAPAAKLEPTTPAAKKSPLSDKTIGEYNAVHKKSWAKQTSILNSARRRVSEFDKKISKQKEGTPEYEKLVEQNNADKDLLAHIEQNPPTRSTKNQAKIGDNPTERMKKREELLKKTPQSIDQFVKQQLLAMDDKRPQGKFHAPSVEKDLSTRKNSTEREFANQFIHEKGEINIDQWANDIANDPNSWPEGLNLSDPEAIKEAITPLLTSYENKKSLQEDLANSFEQSEAENDYWADRSEEAQQAEAYIHQTPEEIRRELSGEEIAKESEMIDLADITEADADIINKYAESVMDENGKIDPNKIDPFSDEYQQAYDGLSKAGKDILDRLYEPDKSENIVNAVKEKSNAKQHTESTSAESGKQSEDVSPRNTDSQEAEASEEPDAYEARIKEIDESLLRQKASQVHEGNLRTKAEKEGDIPGANLHNDNWYKKQTKIDKLNEERESILRSQKDQQVKARFNSYADRIEAKYAENKKRHAGEVYSSIIPGLSPKIVEHVQDFIVAAVVKGIREFGNLDVAIRRAIRHAKDKFGAEAEDLTHSDISAIRDYMGHFEQAPREEPKLPVDHEEYAKDLLADIQDGKITYEEAVQEVHDEVIENRNGAPVSENVADRAKAKILNYIDWHNVDKHINAIREREEVRNAPNKVEASKFNEGSLTSEYLGAKTTKDIFGAEGYMDDASEKKTRLVLDNIMSDVRGIVDLYKDGEKPISEWGRELFNDTKAVQNDPLKQVAALSGLHIELQSDRIKNERDLQDINKKIGTTSDEMARHDLQKQRGELLKERANILQMTGEVQNYKKKVLSSASEVLNAGRVDRMFRDEVLFEHYEKSILSDKERKMKSEMEKVLNQSIVDDYRNHPEYIRERKLEDERAASKKRKEAEEKKAKEPSEQKKKNFVQRIKERSKKSTYEKGRKEAESAFGVNEKGEKMTPKEFLEHLKKLKNPC